MGGAAVWPQGVVAGAFAARVGRVGVGVRFAHPDLRVPDRRRVGRGIRRSG
jgi:hypothetical protein